MHYEKRIYLGITITGLAVVLILVAVGLLDAYLIRKQLPKDVEAYVNYERGEKEA